MSRHESGRSQEGSVMLLGIAIAYYLIAIGLLVAASIDTPLKPHRLIFKALAASGYLFIAVACAVESGHWGYFAWLIPGLVGCFLGDTLLGVKEHDERPYLLAGMVAFGLAHLAFIVCFFQLAGFKPIELIIPALGLVITHVLINLKGVELGKVKPYSYIYGFMVSWLVGKALFVLLELGASTGTVVLLTGALLFLASDILLMFVYFYQHKHVIVGAASAFCYFGGVGLLALSILWLAV